MKFFLRSSLGSNLETARKVIKTMLISRAYLIAFGLMWVGLSAKGASWYVDKDATGSNAGTSWANAFRSFSDIVWGSAGVKAGDTLYISGGNSSKIYNEKWSVGAGGTAENPITIRVGQDAGHNGDVIFDYGAGANQTGNAINLNQHYLTLDGSVGGVSKFHIRNLYNYNDKETATCLYANGKTNVTVRWITASNINNFVQLNYCKNYAVHNNNVNGIRGDYAVRAIMTSGGFDSHSVYSNFFGIWYNSSMPAGATYGYAGADGVQCGSGASIWANTFKITRTTEYTSSQHPDSIQIAGAWVKIFRNKFINIGDSGIDYDMWAEPNPHDVWIYNNQFSTIENIDPYPEFIRVYSTGQAVQSINNLKILNNTFADNDDFRIIFIGYFRGGNPTGNGNEIKNNIFYNAGNGIFHPAIAIDSSSGFTGTTWTFADNVYYSSITENYISYQGVNRKATDHIAALEPSGKTSRPTIVNYAGFQNPNNNFHLSSSDTVAKGAGLNFNSLFATDLDNNFRPAAGSWDRGAYQFAVTGPMPIISVAPTSLVFGSLITGATKDLTFTVVNAGTETLTGNASVSSPFSIISGGSYNLGSNQSQVVTVRFNPTTAADHSQTVNLTGGGGASVAVNGSAAVLLSGLSFDAGAGTLTAPFFMSNGTIYQTLQTGIATGGRAIYNFSITNAGDYVIEAVVSAPSDAENSFFINVDSEPQDPFMVWQIPVTTGSETRIVNWQGNGTWDNPQFVPKVFNLTAGTHQLVIRGREANVRLDRVSIRNMPRPPSALRINDGQSSP